MTSGKKGAFRSGCVGDRLLKISCGSGQKKNEGNQPVLRFGLATLYELGVFQCGGVVNVVFKVLFDIGNSAALHLVSV
jgi:hypothetical protein